MTLKMAYFFRTAAVLGWIIAGVDVSPLGWWNLTPNVYLFVMGATCVTSVAWISCAHSRPMMDMYIAGKEQGRRQVLREQAAGAEPALGSPSLRVIGGGR